MDKITIDTEQEHRKRAMLFYGIIGVFSAVYAVALFFQPTQTPASSSFVLSETARRLLQITFAVPVILIWFLGIESVLESSFYAKKARSETDKALFRTLAWGIGVLLGGFIFGTFVGQLKAYYPVNEFLRRMTTIIVNYTYVFPPLFGFWILSRAVNPAHRSAMREREYNGVAAFLTLLIGIFWVAVIFTNTGRQVSRAGLPPSFYVNDFVIVATIILPTLLAWFYGIVAAFRLADFSAETTERGRERTLSRLVFGIQLLIFSYILLFGLLSLGSVRILGLGLGGVIMALYLFITALFVAHWRISASIKNLSKEYEGGEEIKEE